MKYLVILILIMSCSHISKRPNLNRLYSKTAKYHGPLRNPVIMIPGIMGSQLIEEKSKKVLWGSFSGNYADPHNLKDYNLLALPLLKSKKSEEAHIKATAAIDKIDVDFFGLHLVQKAYVNILKAVGIGGYKDTNGMGTSLALDYGEDHFTCFQFPYDWRKSNVENARRLGIFIDKAKLYVQKKLHKKFGIKNYPVKFNIVAHSMGGILTRYYLRYGDMKLSESSKLKKVPWKGAKNVDKAIFIGTPNLGSIEAFEYALIGRSFGPFLPDYNPALLGTYPSIYEIFPTGKGGEQFRYDDGTQIKNMLDYKLWEKYKWGLYNPKYKKWTSSLTEEKNEKKRNKVIRSFMKKTFRQTRTFHKTLNKKSSPPQGLKLYLIAGDSLKTKSSVSINKKSGKIISFQKTPGDGVVTRSSALGDLRTKKDWSPRLRSVEKWNSVNFVFKEHLELTQDNQFIDNLLFLLLEAS